MELETINEYNDITPYYGKIDIGYISHPMGRHIIHKVEEDNPHMGRVITLIDNFGECYQFKQTFNTWAYKGFTFISGNIKTNMQRTFVPLINSKVYKNSVFALECELVPNFKEYKHQFNNALIDFVKLQTQSMKYLKILGEAIQRDY